MNDRSDRGQILIIGAAAMVVLLAIAGLVIDLGFSWMLRRSEQNAVDPATIAAARYIPDNNYAAMVEAACFYARENGFFQDASANDLGANGCVAANDPNGAVLTVNWPPAGGPPYGGDSGYVEVILDSSHATFFSRVFGFDTMAVTSSAVAANATGDSGVGQLVALDPTTCGAGMIRGGATVTVDGSIYVNSDGSGPPPCPNPFDDLCSGNDGAFRFEGINTRLLTPQLSVRGTCGQNANPYPANCTPSYNCGLTEGAPQIEDPFNLQTPTIAWAGVPAPATSSSGPISLANCDGPTDTGCTFAGGPGSWYLLNPGVYYGGWSISREVRLNPGFYYIAGGGIQVTGQGTLVTIGPSGLPDGDGRILLYSTDGPNCVSLPSRLCQGPLLMEGQGGFQARAYEQDPVDPFDDDYQRLLIWQAEGTSATLPIDTNFDNDIVRIAGQGLLDFWGTIYAPKSVVEIQGNGTGSGNVAGVQVLAWRFDVSGNADLHMPFDANELSPILSKGLVR
jgi:hypothetical protein